MLARLTGVIHFARQVNDRLLVNKSFDEFARTMAAKVQGSINIDAVTANEALDFFILYSSMAAFGIAGSADYGYATGVQNALVRQRERLVADGQRQGKSLALCFGQWVVDPYSDQQRDAMLAKAGFGFIDLPSALSLMACAIDGPQAVVGMMAVANREQVKSHYGLAGQGKVQGRVQGRVQDRVQDKVQGSQDDLTLALQQLSGNDQQALKKLLSGQSVTQLETLLQTLNLTDGENDND